MLVGRYARKAAAASQNYKSAVIKVAFFYELSDTANTRHDLSEASFFFFFLICLFFFPSTWDVEHAEVWNNGITTCKFTTYRAPWMLRKTRRVASGMKTFVTAGEIFYSSTHTSNFSWSASQITGLNIYLSEKWLVYNVTQLLFLPSERGRGRGLLFSARRANGYKSQTSCF